jgi:Fe(3+) dicitrate transport protein
MKYSFLSKKIGFLTLAWLVSATLFGQVPKGTIKGFVQTSDGKPAESVHISLSETHLGAVTEANGRFSLSVPAGDYTVMISIIGFAPQEKKITVKAGETSVVDFTLNETAYQLQEVVIKGVRAITGMGYLAETNDNMIYAGKKTEVLLLDSLDANTAQNNPRQVLGRVPGANYSETEGSGFPSNGIGFRGLNPSQSIETNTRQNGYNITADLYGYPESYYLPPLEAVQRIEVIRGASSLQYGAQFGGVINYILKKGHATKPFEFTSQQTVGSFGLFNTFNAVGGQVGKFNYYAYGQYQTTQGWRPNSDFQKFNGFARVEFKASDKVKVGLEYSILRNRIHMPGGLTDSLFNIDSRQSTRARNWIRSPWNIIAATLDWKLSSNSTLTIKSAFNFSARDIVWRNEYGGAQAVDGIDPATNEYVNREVGRQVFESQTTEMRLLSNYGLGKTFNTLAAGVRFFSGKLKRQGGGEGTTGTDFDLTLVNPMYEYVFNFTTTNMAPFIENTFRFGERVSITPGLRYEFLQSTIQGYNPADAGGITTTDKSRIRSIFLAGIGAQIKTTSTTNVYANWSQAYRPFDYSSLTPLGTIATVDPALKDSDGYNADIGFRGSVKDFLNFDVSTFYLRYNNRVGVIEKTDGQGNQFPYRTNVAASVHKGLETYIEFSVTKAFLDARKWNLSFFNSLALIDAKYISGEYNGKQVEYAPTSIHRFGTTVAIQKFSTTFLISSTAKSFGDAANATTPSTDAVAGIIPAYTVMDWSASWRIKNFNVKAGLNNVADERYFTKRTDEYPGPGIIPSIGRSFYFGVGVKF